MRDASIERLTQRGSRESERWSETEGQTDGPGEVQVEALPPCPWTDCWPGEPPGCSSPS